jgi:hypothetical protein
VCVSVLTRLFQQGLENLAGTTLHHLFFVTVSRGTVTAGPAEKPAQVPTLKLPGRALLLHPALFYIPAGADGLEFAPAITEKEKDLAFNVGRNRSPSLFVAMNGLQCNSEQFSHLFLCFSKFFPGFKKFFRIQWGLLVYEGCYYL